MNPLLALVYKELRVELRSKQALMGSLVLAVLILFTFRITFSLMDEKPDSESLAPGVIWSAVIFAGLGLVGSSFNKEVDRHTLEGLWMAPLSRAHLFGGKLAGNLVLLYLVEGIIVLAFAALFSPDPFAGQGPRLVAILVLGGLGFAAIGTLMAAMTSRVPGSWVLLPLLVVPLLIKTVLEMAVAATTYLIEGDLGLFNGALSLLLLYDIIFVLAGLRLAEYAL